VDGDSFIINYGHIVTINDDQRVTNGYDDSYVRGKLQITGTGKLRMNGILYVDNSGNYAAYFSEGNSSTASFFRMDAGSLLEIRGTNVDQHRLQIQNHQYVTCEIEGTNPNPSTTLNGAVDTNATSLVFSDASNFKAGDWINVYLADYGSTYLYNKSDEAFWIHDVDGNTVYFRHFVGPSCSIQYVSGNTIIVDDAAVLRDGMKIIFGTGANRNVGSISYIDYQNNKIIFSTAVSGSVIGEKIYQTGTEKCHYNGSTILRVAATLTSDQSSGENTIVVNNVNGFNVGDLILIPNNDLDNYTSWDYVQDFYVTAVDSNTNTITFSSGLTDSNTTTIPYSVKSGGIVVNMTRDTKITAPSYSSTEQSFVYVVYSTSGTMYYRRLRFKDVFINLGGNTYSGYYGGASFSGLMSYDSTSYGQYVSYVDGVVIIPNTRVSGSGGAYSPNPQQTNRRNCVTYNAYYGYYVPGNNLGLFCNIACRITAFPFRGTFGEPNTEISYDYVIRSANVAHYIDGIWEHSCPIRHNYVLGCMSRPILIVQTLNGYSIDRCYFDGYVYWPYVSLRVGKIKILNSYLGNKWDITGGGALYSDGLNTSNDGQTIFPRGNAFAGLCESIKHNFKHDSSAIWGQVTWRIYDKNERAWLVRPTRGWGSYCGFYNTVFVPANCKLYIRGRIKMVSGNTNYPYIIVKEAYDYYDGKYRTLGDVALSPDSPYITEIAGFTTEERFTSASQNDYETIDMVLPVQAYDYIVNIGVILINTNVSGGKYGWYEKDLIITTEKPYTLNDQSIFNQRTTQIPVVTKSTNDKLKIRLGGGY
jgi:hypothetical protein